jgi:Fe-S-cluster-containing dehydrogenase component
MTRYRLRIDEALCWGCKTCEVACKAENGAPIGVKLIRVTEDGPTWKDDGLSFSFRVRRCRHCKKPQCAEACDFGAIFKRADGIVVLHQNMCSGCKACIDACPYDAVEFDVARGVVSKCDLCRHRIDRGLLPACADNVCLAHCIHLVATE